MRQILAKGSRRLLVSIIFQGSPTRLKLLETGTMRYSSLWTMFILLLVIGTRAIVGGPGSGLRHHGPRPTPAACAPIDEACEHSKIPQCFTAALDYDPVPGMSFDPAIIASCKAEVRAQQAARTKQDSRSEIQAE